jgi:hypothetical protein
MAKNRRLSDREVVAICEAEIESSSGFYQGELATQRADAMDHYLGEPYGDEIDGRSQIRTREVLDTIEWILPSLLRIYTDVDNAVEFDPVGPEDVEMAEQETDRVNFAYWKENDGFLNTYTWFKDALLSKTGVIKYWWDETETEEKEEYRGLNWLEVAELLNDPDYDREVLTYDEGDQGIDIEFKATKKGGRIALECTPPEEFGVIRSARSPKVDDLTFCYHRTKKTYSDLVEMGLPRKLLDRIPFNDDVETEERISRRNLDDEQEGLRTAYHKSMRETWVTECYLRLDRDGDGIGELLKVTMATGPMGASTGSVLLDGPDHPGIEEVDHMPFVAITPYIRTHTFYGLSVADLVMDLQRIKSTIFRQVLDNTYLSTNQERAVNENVNLSDMLTRRPGNVVRVRGKEDPRASIFPVPPQPVPDQTYGLLEYLDELRKNRTGVGDEVAALDPKALQNVNTGVAALAYDAARAKIELIARIFGELGFRRLFKGLHEVLSKRSERAKTIRIRGKWVEVNPQEWRKRENMTVQVGMGVTSKEKKLLALEATMEKQGEAVQGGGLGTILMPEHLYNARAEYSEVLGLKEASKYWMDPAEAPPPPPQKDPLDVMERVEAGKMQVAHEKNQVEMEKLRLEREMAGIDLERKEREQETKSVIEGLKLQAMELKTQADAAEKERKQELEAIRLDVEAQIKVREQDLKQAQENAKRQVDMLRAYLQSQTQITTTAMTSDSSDGNGGGGMKVPYIFDADEVLAEVTETVQGQKQTIAELQGKLDENQNLTSEQLSRAELSLARAIERIEGQEYTIQELRERNDAPLEVRRDADGLIVSVNGRQVLRDASGRVSGIG